MVECFDAGIEQSKVWLASWTEVDPFLAFRGAKREQFFKSLTGVQNVKIVRSVVRNHKLKTDQSFCVMIKD